MRDSSVDARVRAAVCRPGYGGAPAAILLPVLLLLVAVARAGAEDLDAAVLAAEAARVETIARVTPAVVCVLDANRAGGGSGVLIDADGYGLTNFHVVAGLLKTPGGFGGLSDGKAYPLTVLGIDPTGDVAMFRLTGRERFHCVELGDSDRVRPGDEVLAAGNPFLLAEDYTPTVTWGIVSGVNRYQWGAGRNQLTYTDCIQVDASINPGNSGGPLFDSDGRLIGINGRAAFEERGRVNVGLGFAISINQIRRFLPGLRAGLLVEHGTLGATVADTGYRHVVFDRIQAGSAAARAGLRVGERLLSFDGRAIHSANQFANILGTYPAGWPVEVELAASATGERRTVRIALDRLPVKAPPGYETDEEVTRRAALSLHSRPAPGALPAPAGPNAVAAAIARVQPCIVKLYGAGAAAEHGYGSGVLVSPDGLVVTTISLLLESSRVRAVTADGHLYLAEVRHRDPVRQLALLQLRARPEDTDTDLPVAWQAASTTFRHLAPAASTAVRSGEFVLAFGNPFKVAEGDEPVSVTKGVISARMRLDARHRLQDFPYRGEVLAVDAITGNPGSAGGALVDLDGNWLGIVGRGVYSYLTNTRLNFAIPIEEVAAFLAEARSGRAAPAASAPATAPASKGYHGIRLFALAYRQGLPFVERVDLGSPAERAGVRKEDLIISANGVSIPNARAFQRVCDALLAGDELVLVIKRGQELLTVTLTLARRAE